MFEETRRQELGADEEAPLSTQFFATFLTIVAKFARYTDSSFFFSGGSLRERLLSTFQPSCG